MEKMSEKKETGRKPFCVIEKFREEKMKTKRSLKKFATRVKFPLIAHFFPQRRKISIM